MHIIAGKCLCSSAYI